ncbi:putative cyclic nucleotide-gated ion channel 13 isoform X2 [Rosa chinensis]|uniref:putative cyclic nucleotide-gated ion channel 13 isoform X2 n=1 Tax=Rosa chinensis TaxID=74649 RepID=UPI001AD900DA|nr:putative cyclic nucleotide-gated ion channel 13 isoform X2 [Rosa chinensis]
MSNQVDNVLIDLRNLDGVNLLGESDKENRGQRSTSAEGPAVQEIIKARAKRMYKWNTFFIILCSFAVFVDPLFCYLNVIEEDNTCFNNDWKLLLTYACLRIVVDVFYAVDIIIFLCGVFKKRKGKKLWACWKSRNDQKTIVPWKQVIKRYSVLLSILPGALVAFPILELFGALWYRLAVQRQIDCWKTNSKIIRGIKIEYWDQFECTKARSSFNSSLLQELCPTKDENSKVFDFGIYFYALHSNVTNSSSLSRRMSLSFWWALRNLSSFGSNLLTSMQIWEIIFSMAISICGMVLFLVYLNARVQESQERSHQLKLKEKKHLMKPDIDLWLSKNDLSKLKTVTKSSKDLQTTNLKEKALKTVILENIHKLEENKDIDVQNIISILPIKYKKSVMRLLCLASLKKVPMLENLNEKMLKVICEHLKPVIYMEDSYIIQEGKPLGMTLFITHGIAWTYTVSNNVGAETSCGSSSNKWLKRGDYYGEELLKWAFKCPSYSDLPISTRTVMSQERVEAFALRASDLKSIVSKYWWHFTRELPQVELKQWENSATSSIQAAWRSHLARARHSNGWDKFTVGH